jgi:hypothetical protein
LLLLQPLGQVLKLVVQRQQELAQQQQHGAPLLRAAGRKRWLLAPSARMPRPWQPTTRALVRALLAWEPRARARGVLQQQPREQQLGQEQEEQPPSLVAQRPPQRLRW